MALHGTPRIDALAFPKVWKKVWEVELSFRGNALGRGVAEGSGDLFSKMKTGPMEMQRFAHFFDEENGNLKTMT